MKFCLYKKKCEFCENIVINNFEIDMYSLVFSGTELQKLTTQYERRSLGLNREELISQIESCCLHDILEGIYQFHINYVGGLYINGKENYRLFVPESNNKKVISKYKAGI